MSVAIYDRAYARVLPMLERGAPSWVRERRAHALEVFRATGFPSLRDEEWRFTRVKPIAETEFGVVEGYRPGGMTAVQLSSLTFDDTGCHRVVLVDGHFAPELSMIKELPRGVWLGSLSQALAERPEWVEPYLGRLADVEANPFVALNTAFMWDGLFLHVDDDVVVEEPVHLVVTSTHRGTMAHPRILAVTGKNSALKLIESYAGTGSEYFTNAVTEMVCGENADVTHCKVQREATTSYHVATQHAQVARNGRFTTENISLGGGLVRNDVYSVLDGEGVDCRVDGLYLANRRQHIDNHTYIRHARPHCHSYELYKGILNGKARGVFNGKIYVDPGAQKTDAKQSNNCLLLSEDARINTNPQLEIFADDVKCTHGATIGQIDEDAVFYMRSRGVPDTEARHILVYAFASEVLERIRVDHVRARLQADLFDWLESHYQEAA